MNSLRISIIMANYNNSRFIQEAIQSVLCQTNPSFDLEILDDCSTDNSWEIISTFANDPRIHIRRSARNAGYIATLDDLIRTAKNPIIGILDSDDTLKPDAVERVLSVYAQNSNAEFVYSQFSRINGSNRISGKGYCKPWNSHQNHLIKPCISHWKTFTVALYKRIGGYNPTMTFCEDFDLVYKLEEATVPIFIDSPLYNYRELPHSQSHAPQKKALGLLNRSRAMLSAFSRRKHLTSIGNLSRRILCKKIILTLAYGLLNRQWKGIANLLRDLFRRKLT